MFIVTILVLLVVCHQVHCFYGLIGGIGSGKSVAAQLFAEQNWVVADVDVFNRTCLFLPQVQNKIRKRWSDLPHEASLQRLWLRRQLLTNEGDREFLETLLRPMVQQQAMDWATQQDQPKILQLPWVKGMDLQLYGFTGMIHITASLAVRRQRLEHKGWSKEEVDRVMMLQQQPIVSYDHTLINEGSLTQLKKQIVELSHKIIGNDQGL